MGQVWRGRMERWSLGRRLLFEGKGVVGHIKLVVVLGLRSIIVISHSYNLDFSHAPITGGQYYYYVNRKTRYQ